jgi:dipeptidyl aminopeptidase/acylaminoacyl peptidase
LTKLNPEMDKYRMGATRLIEWQSLDGKVLHGIVQLPAGYEAGKRYPLVVCVYGGDLLSQQSNRFGGYPGLSLNSQLLATRGYAVLYPDAPQELGTPMLDLAKTILPGVNKAVELGIADPDRLGVIGTSYGGYTTLSLLVQTKRFTAAVMVSGYSDIVSAYGEFGKDGSTYSIAVEEQGQGLMGGTPWQFRERYIENSPIFYLDRVEAPLLILHGTADTAVASFLGDEVFVGLRRLGKEVEYAKYEGEGHGLEGSYANQLDRVNRVIRWFDEHLKKQEDKAGADKQKPN